MQTQIDEGAEAILAIDYDSLFSIDDLTQLIQLFHAHPEVDALVPVQAGREGMSVLMNVRTKTGRRETQVPRKYFDTPISKIATGHFGLTLLRTEALMKMPHPWLWDQPGENGQWYAGKADADIYFWRQLIKSGGTVYSANRVVIGHLELMAAWPSHGLHTIHQRPREYFESGKPADVWK